MSIVHFGRTLKKSFLGKKLISHILPFLIKKSLGGNIKTFVSGGSSVNSDTEEFFKKLGLEFCNGYGMTETSMPISTTNGNRYFKGKNGECFGGVDLKTSSEGEILVKSPGVFMGYLNDESKTKESFLDDGWLRTGDLGVVHDDGSLDVTGRIKDVIILSTGKKLSPDELEILYKPYIDRYLPGYEHSIAAVPSDIDDKYDQPCLFVANINKLNKKLNVETILDQINKEFSSTINQNDKLISKIIEVDVLPRSSTKKIKRNLLKNEYKKVISFDDKLINESPDFLISLDIESKKILTTVASIGKVNTSSHNIMLKRIYSDLGFDSLMSATLISALNIKDEKVATFLMTKDLTVSDLIDLYKNKDLYGNKDFSMRFTKKTRLAFNENRVINSYFPGLFTLKHLKFFFWLPFGLCLLSVRLFFMCFFAMISMLIGRKFDDDLFYKAFVFICFGVLIKSDKNKSSKERKLFVVAPHVHYLDSLVVKTINKNLGTFLNYKKMYQKIDSIWKFKFHPEDLKFNHDKEGFEAGIKHINDGNSFFIFPEGTVKKDEKVIFLFHNTLFKYFDEVQPVVLNYKYFINFKYGYQYPGFIIMDIISLMMSPYTICEVKVLPSVKVEDYDDIDSLTRDLRKKMASEIPGGYLEDYLYTPEIYADLFNKFIKE